jgi:hypothetical protein
VRLTGPPRPYSFSRNIERQPAAPGALSFSFNVMFIDRPGLSLLYLAIPARGSMEVCMRSSSRFVAVLVLECKLRIRFVMLAVAFAAVCVASEQVRVTHTQRLRMNPSPSTEPCVRL